MKKLLLSVGVCGLFAMSSYLPAHEAHVESMGSLLAASWIANTCITMPLVSRFATTQLVATLGSDNLFLAVLSGLSIGYLTSVATEEILNFFVLKASKQYGNAIVAQAQRWIHNSAPLPGLIRLLAFFASLPSGLPN